MDKEEPTFKIWGEISESNMVLEASKVEQKYEKQQEKRHFVRVIFREISQETKNICLRPVRVKGGISLRNGMWHGLRNDIIMQNVKYGNWRKEIN